MIAIAANTYIERRKRFIAQMQPNSLAFVFSSPQYPRGLDDTHSYRQDNDFYYLTGFPESESLAVLIKGEKDESHYLLFSQPSNPVQELWEGGVAGQLGATKNYHADVWFPIQQIDQELPELLKNKSCLYYAYGKYPVWDLKLNSVIHQLRYKTKKGIQVPHEVINVENILHEMRLIKSAEEIALIQKAIDITQDSILNAIAKCNSNLYEYQLVGILLERFRNGGAMAESFLPIVAGGKNACTLHYGENNQKLKDGDLVLIDTGCEYQNYCSDISRTFPVNGRFSQEQKAIYEIVLAAQEAVIQHLKPGCFLIEGQKIANRIITEGLHDLKILKGDLKDLIETEASKTFFPHGIGHWLGLECHDVGDYQKNGQWRPFEPNMVFTVEPGIYIPPHWKGIDSKWKGIGIRIEDDVWMTHKGLKVLSKAIPKTIQEIESLMK